MRTEAFSTAMNPARFAIGASRGVFRRLRCLTQFVRVAAHSTLAGGGEAAPALRIVRLERGAELEVGPAFATAVLCPDSHAQVRAALGVFYLARRNWILLEAGGTVLVRNTSARTVWVLAFEGALLQEESRLAALWPDAGRLCAGTLTLLRERLQGEVSGTALAHAFEHLARANMAADGDAGFDTRNPGHAAQVRRRIRTARLYLQGHLGEGATVEDAAQVALLSKWYFSRLFQRLYGTSPQAHAADLRVTRARHLIVHTRLPLNEIAALCGFENPGSMSRAFRARYGANARDLRLAATRPK
jgi:AraC family transcriptional regulator